MSKIEALNSEFVNPSVVVSALEDDCLQFSSLYAVAHLKDGTIVVYSTPNLGDMAISAAVLQSRMLDLVGSPTEIEFDPSDDPEGA